MRVLRPRYLLEVLLVDVFLHRLSITRGQGVALITLSSCFRGYDRWLLTKEAIKDCLGALQNLRVFIEHSAFSTKYFEVAFRSASFLAL